MALIVTMAAELPPEILPTYVTKGTGAFNVRISVSNTGLVSEVIQQIYLVPLDIESNGSFSLGNTIFRYIGSSLNTTNNIIAAGETKEYIAAVQPQVSALTWPQNEYVVSLDCVLQISGQATTQRALQTINIKVRPPETIGYEIVSPVTLWVRTINNRPPQNIGFDFDLQVRQLFDDETSIILPVEDLWWETTDPGTINVFPYSEGTNVQFNPYNPETEAAEFVAFQPRFLPSGGSAAIWPSWFQEGEVTVSVRRGGALEPIIATTKLSVVNRIPVSLTVVQQSVPFRFNSNFAKCFFKIFLNFNDGTVVDVSNSGFVSMQFPSWVNFGGSGTDGPYFIFLITNFSAGALSIFTPTIFPATFTYTNAGIKISTPSTVVLQKTV